MGNAQTVNREKLQVRDTFVKELIHTTSVFSSSLTNRGTTTCSGKKIMKIKIKPTTISRTGSSSGT
jgi:transcription initiation factor TFIID subunit TAF12